MSQDGLDGSARLDEQRAAAVRHLVAQTAEVGRVSGRGPWWRELLKCAVLAVEEPEPQRWTWVSASGWLGPAAGAVA